jgi:hypothetical protein
MHHDAVVNRHWERLYEYFPGFQIVVCEGEEVVAAGHTIPVSWDGTVGGLPAGLDSVLETAVRDAELGHAPTAVSALLALVPGSSRGRGLSRVVLEGMKKVAAERGLVALIAPVRPTLKHLYPLTPMERYALWRRDDGLPFDPWLRVHERLGARFLSVAPRSMTVEGTVQEWEAWTGMRFPESGPYVVPGALSPVEVDVEEDLGRYAEPNVWMKHPISGSLETAID